MYPHERSLVKRLANQRFALLGINSDSDRDELRKTVKEEQITWRSWWDDGSVNGSIQTEWQVTERPAIYILDVNGIIRHKNVEANDLDRIIDTMLDELTGKSGG